jgi:hypothetical protein
MVKAVPSRPMPHPEDPFEIGLLLVRQPRAASSPHTETASSDSPVRYTLYYKPILYPAILPIVMQATQFGVPPRRRQTSAHAVDFLSEVMEGDLCQVQIIQPESRRSACFRVARGEIADLAVTGALRVECTRATPAFHALYGLTCQIGKPLVNVYVTARDIETHSSSDQTPPFGALFALRERRMALFTCGCPSEREHLLTCLHYIPAAHARYYWWDGEEAQGVSGRVLEERLAAIHPAPCHGKQEP